jgi:hypothetical protein
VGPQLERAALLFFVCVCVPKRANMRKRLHERGKPPRVHTKGELIHRRTSLLPHPSFFFFFEITALLLAANKEMFFSVQEKKKREKGEKTKCRSFRCAFNQPTEGGEKKNKAFSPIQATQFPRLIRASTV